MVTQKTCSKWKLSLVVLIIRKSSFSILTAFFIIKYEVCMEELTDKKKQRLDRLHNKYKYKNHENFLIAKSARKTVRYTKRKWN